MTYYKDRTNPQVIAGGEYFNAIAALKTTLIAA